MKYILHLSAIDIEPDIFIANKIKGKLWFNFFVIYYILQRAPGFFYVMGLLPDTENCRLRMRRECRERFPPPPI